VVGFVVDIHIVILVSRQNDEIHIATCLQVAVILLGGDVSCCSYPKRRLCRCMMRRGMEEGREREMEKCMDR